MKYVKVIIVLAIVSMIFAGCEAKEETLVVEELLSSSDYVPESNLLVEDVRDDVANYIACDKTYLEIEELTNKHLWEDKKIQVFSLKNDQELSNSIAVYKEGKLLDLFTGQNVLETFIADIDADEEYELCMNFSQGFGYVRTKVVAYDFETEMKFEYDMGSDLFVDIKPGSEVIDVFTSDGLKEPIAKQGEDGALQIEMIKKHIGILRLIENELVVDK